ncbi:hypothetical protein F183_A29150 [Bryobacterales bacterium F-183]|nr:hypothetical protein F183_A29150 [Bryobacterales bacterium F-183]
MNEQRPKFLAMLAEEDRLAEAPRRVEIALRERVRAKQAAVAPASGWFRWRSFWAGAAMAAAAAAAIVVWMRPAAQTAVPAAPSVANVVAAPVVVAGTEESAPAVNVEKLMAASSAPKPMVRRKSAAKAATEGAEQGSRSFYSISYASPELLANAQIVRVRIPSSALMQFGLPMSAYRSSGGQVEADVIYTEDGIARAIRFVPQEFRKE